MRNLKNTQKLFFTLAVLCFVLLNSCATRPPTEPGNFMESDLVELIRLDPTFKLDVRYATSNNFAGKPVYPEARVFLQRPAAENLIKVNNELKAMGYGLLLFDGYRPWSITKLFWDITPKADKKFVADPKKGSRHNRGCAIDVSIYEITSGKEVQMPGEYDETSERSYPDYKGGTDEQRKMRNLLIKVMEANEFKVYEFEWWHFDYKDWKSYRIQNIPFSEIE